MGDDWWKWRLCYEIKLTTTVKTFTRYINRSRAGAKQQQQTIKQTKRYRNSWIFRQKNKQTNEKKLKKKKKQKTKNIFTNRNTSRLAIDIHKDKIKHITQN